MIHCVVWAGANGEGRGRVQCELQGGGGGVVLIPRVQRPGRYAALPHPSFPPPRKTSRSMYYGEHGVAGFVGEGGRGGRERQQALLALGTTRPHTSGLYGRM